MYCALLRTSGLQQCDACVCSENCARGEQLLFSSPVGPRCRAVAGGPCEVGGARRDYEKKMRPAHIGGMCCRGIVTVI